MRKIYILMFSFVLLQYVRGQEVEFKKETKQLVDNRSLYINGGTRSYFGGKSRTYIKIDLPPNTVEWYYSFSTSEGKSGAKNLDLAIQLSGFLASPSGITSKLVSAIEIPKGVASADVYLIDKGNLRLFLEKNSFNHYSEAMVENTKQAIVKIDDVKSGSWYLGIKNPSSLNGINLIIEVVAITKTPIMVEKSNRQKKAELYGRLGWVKFEDEDYQKCVEYCDKSNSEYELGWVQANKGLATLILGKNTEAMDIYINAIMLIKKQPNSNFFFREIIKDIDKVISKKKNLIGVYDIKKVIELERR